uniref:SECIS binding protein 2 n=1 Tax=Eptatretus burgeri TaxID=7764 RepID=A0A8C4QBF9_EPTBU
VRKSNLPVQLDLGEMLEELQRQKQKQKESPKGFARPLSLSGGLIALAHALDCLTLKRICLRPHNPLDSSGPTVKRGKCRESPKPKKPTSLKKVILKEREDRKQLRLVMENGKSSVPEGGVTENKDDSGACCNCVPAEDITTTSPSAVVCPVKPLVPCRYCSQMLSREVDACVRQLLAELVRLQERLYQRDPERARRKRRFVLGLREVTKHLRIGKLCAMLLSPNCERSRAHGGLDEALWSIIRLAREQKVPVVFALDRRSLGHCLHKKVPVSVVGIFHYGGTHFHHLMQLTKEARTAYLVKLQQLQNEEQGVSSEHDEEEIGMKGIYFNLSCTLYRVVFHFLCQ